MVQRAGVLILLLFCYGKSIAIDASLSHTLFYVADPAQAGKLIPQIEMYWQINPRTLHYKLSPEKTIVAHMKTDIVFTTDAGIVKEDHYVLETVPRQNIQDLKTHSIIEMRSYKGFSPGFIHVKLTMMDLNDSTNKYSAIDTFTVIGQPGSVFYSGIQILDTIIHSTAQTNFYKNGVQQVPECANFLDENKQTLNYYAERYFTSKIPGADYPLVQKVIISKNEDESPFGNFIKTDTIKDGVPERFSGSFLINSLPSGNYYVKVFLENRHGNTIASQSLFFQRINTHPAPLPTDTVRKTAGKAVSDTGFENVTILNLKKTFVAKYDVSDIRAILKMLLPFSDPGGTQAINNFLKKPDELYMRYFVYNFFVGINKKDPEKAWKEFSQKIIEANELYNNNGVRGYETDRGFIYLRYGKPTDIITVENESGSQPYEIWTYEVLTQTNHKEITDAFFLFYRQTQGLSDFKILHSSVDGETRNMNWRSFLYTNGANTSNSRAQQYIGNR